MFDKVLKSKNRSKKKGKRNKKEVVDARWDKKEQQGRHTSEKHMEFRKESIKNNPIKPWNTKQATYLDSLYNKDVNIAVGYAGTSKTYLPTRVAIEKLLLEEISKIVIVRPAISDSKSLGFFGGDKLEKSLNWIAPVLDTLNEFLGSNNVLNLLKNDVIVPVPLEVIKGQSFNDSFIIVDEAEDLTRKEFIKCITRLGKNSSIVFAGDVLQTDLVSNNGLDLALELAQEPALDYGVTCFDDFEDIVRSRTVKETIIALNKKGLM